MTREDFQLLIMEHPPQDLAERFLFADQVTVFDAETYTTFRGQVSSAVPGTEHIAIVGTGNWRYSLNPRKSFSEFSRNSDIDVAVISKDQFHFWWEQMRKHHRDKYYTLTFEERRDLCRSGENVYAGFISPLWIPRCNKSIVYSHKSMLNKLSSKLVGHREVKMLFFKDHVEAIDYYRRGFEFARRALG